jgi:hypothetical protein
MSIIAIRDLPDSVELDRQAMAAIVGGARNGAQYGSLLSPAAKATRIVDYPQGFASTHQLSHAVNARTDGRKTSV